MKINIKNLVDTSGMSKNKIAKKLDISYPTMLSLYNGEATSIRLDILGKICSIFNCTPNDILIGESESSQKYQTYNLANTSYPSQQNLESISNHLFNDTIAIAIDEDGNLYKDIMYENGVKYKLETTKNGETIAIPFIKVKSKNTKGGTSK